MSRYRVLFVCLGNICRSPAAEIIFRQMAEDAGRSEDFHVDSAGTSGFHAGSPPDQRMGEALVRQGFRISGRSRQVHALDLEEFDLIVPMDEANDADLRALDTQGNYAEKIQPLVSFCRRFQVERVPDPYYGGESGFHHVIELLKDGCEGILEREF